jgi:hypothetical protein
MKDVLMPGSPRPRSGVAAGDRHHGWITKR